MMWSMIALKGLGKAGAETGSLDGDGLSGQKREYIVFWGGRKQVQWRMME